MCCMGSSSDESPLLRRMPANRRRDPCGDHKPKPNGGGMAHGTGVRQRLGRGRSSRSALRPSPGEAGLDQHGYGWLALLQVLSP